ncbi:adenylate/guanylate cyclase domain-containing protein [Polaribacter cellanae]|uniref:Tetratricopeptide repeat protein n=1 Tax=Polaribacter cellanae TaxID=2818493 RepID=A0A975CSR6_9FLAO|nr:adenylate/guanylate cyclase domain-containing protein [Polaribacter cellanae]QTE23307.1 tetratricopeptide repeat protein [Polaribacter cellanae]
MFVFNNILNSIKEKCYFTSLLFFILIPTILNGQIKYKNIADSLFSKSKIHLKKGEYDIALSLVEQSLLIFNKTKKYKAIADNYNQIATIYFYKSEFRKALTAFQKSKTFFKKADFKNGIASSTNNIGAIYYSLGNYSKAIDNYKWAIKIHEELQNEAQIAGTTQNIGNIYYVLNDFVNAKIYYEKAEKNHQKSKNNEALALVKSSLGRIYLKEKQFSKALIYFNTSLKLARDSNNKQVQTEVLYNIGDLYKSKKNFLESVKYLKQSVLIAEEIKNDLQKSTSLVTLGTVYLEFNKINLAISNCNKGLLLAEQIKTVSIQEEACKCLYEGYKSKNNLFKALQYNEQMYLLRDSLNLKQTSGKILNMKFEKEMLLDSIAHVEKERKVTLAHQKVVEKKEKQRNIFIIAGCFALLLAIGIFSRLNFVKKSKARLQVEKDRSEHLLHNILPEEVAEELKEKGYVDAQDFETTSILFTDFKSFTETASKLSPQELVEEINVCFKAFDNIMEQYNIEKIKTIGDAYMAAGGLPQPDINAVKNTIMAALDMQTFVSKRKRENDAQNKPAFEMRVGIHVGPIVAGIVGVKKFQYDIWGDTVNTASRMESNSEVGKVNISQDTYLLVKNEKDLAFEYRGKIATKGKGDLEMYFVSKALI